MQKAAWDLTPYSGQKMFIKVVDFPTSMIVDYVRVWELAE